MLPRDASYVSLFSISVSFIRHSLLFRSNSVQSVLICSGVNIRDQQSEQTKQNRQRHRQNPLMSISVSLLSFSLHFPGFFGCFSWKLSHIWMKRPPQFTKQFCRRHCFRPPSSIQRFTDLLSNDTSLVYIVFRVRVFFNDQRFHFSLPLLRARECAISACGASNFSLTTYNNLMGSRLSENIEDAEEQHKEKKSI